MEEYDGWGRIWYLVAIPECIITRIEDYKLRFAHKLEWMNLRYYALLM